MELEFQFRRNIDFEVEQLMQQIEKIKNQFREYYLKHKENINLKSKSWRKKNENYKKRS